MGLSFFSMVVSVFSGIETLIAGDPLFTSLQFTTYSLPRSEMFVGGKLLVP